MSTLDAALWYVARGWRVLPLWPVYHAGDAWVCLCCDGGACPRPGKHPASRGGVLDATTDAARVLAGWSRFYDRRGALPGVGVATGAGLCVVDLDAPALGEETWSALTDAHGRVDTVESLTGRGRHLWLRTRTELPSTAGRLGPGVDIRAAGGYVVAPPSRHVSGRVYGWEASSDPTDGVPLAWAPPWLAKLACEPARTPLARVAAGERVQIGGRNDAVMRYACSLRGRGLGGAELSEAVARWNASVCEPPLALREVRAIVRGIVRRYPAGASVSALAASARVEASATRALRLMGDYSFRDDPAYWLGSLGGEVPADPNPELASR